VTSIASEVLSRLEGFEPRSVQEHKQLASDVAIMLQRMLQGEHAMQLLASLKPQQPLHLQERQLEEAVRQEVDAAEAVDLHTHLFSVGHHGGQTMQYGIDALLTYHYLVSEFLATAHIDPEDFYRLPQREQADLVWHGLFIKASPISEHCRGVLTTLAALGLREEVAARDLEAIRRWYAGQNPDMFNEKMMRLARLRYVVTSHDVFDAQETASCLSPPAAAHRYRGMLALDKLFEGDWSAVCQLLTQVGEPRTLRGVAQLLGRCVAALHPMFLTAATPHDFDYSAAGAADDGSSQEWLLDAPLDPIEGDGPRKLPSHGDLLDLVVLPLCKKAKLPLSLRMGTRRGLCSALRLAGDGVGSAQLASLAQLCRSYPGVKFMATVLSRSDQHEVAVMAGKFQNLHLWGCWWYCNNPSVVSEVTSLRMELLGTGFTFQASSARVHDQLIYKWIHSRALLARALTSKYSELMATGWRLSRGDIRRDVSRLLGGSFEEFVAKRIGD